MPYPYMVFLCCLAVGILIVGIYGISRALSRDKQIREDGLYAIGVVVRCETKKHNGTTRHTPYISYIGNDCQEHICTLSCSCNMPIGRRVKIQYLPGQYDYALFIEQDLNDPAAKQD